MKTVLFSLIALSSVLSTSAMAARPVKLLAGESKYIGNTLVSCSGPTKEDSTARIHDAYLSMPGNQLTNLAITTGMLGKCTATYQGGGSTTDVYVNSTPIAYGVENFNAAAVILREQIKAGNCDPMVDPTTNAVPAAPAAMAITVLDTVCVCTKNATDLWTARLTVTKTYSNGKTETNVVYVGSNCEGQKSSIKACNK